MQSFLSTCAWNPIKLGSIVFLAQPRPPHNKTVRYDGKNRGCIHSENHPRPETIGVERYTGVPRSRWNLGTVSLVVKVDQGHTIPNPPP